MLTLHHLDNSRSLRILWLLEELGLDYRLVRHQRDPGTMLAPAALRELHPLGKAPLLIDEDDRGRRRVIIESALIIEHLLDRYAPDSELRPAAGSEARRRYAYWLHYAEGSLMPLLLLKLVFARVEQGSPAMIRPIARKLREGADSAFTHPQLALHLDYLEGELERFAWFAGDDFSAADIQMGFPLEIAASRGGLGEERTALNAFLERIRARPAYQRAAEKGGKAVG